MGGRATIPRCLVSSGTRESGRACGGARGGDHRELLPVMVVAVVTVLVHPVHAVLSRPYWLDEAWVATLTKAPLFQVPRLNASTPVGFIALLKVVPGSGLQRGRLVVLGFSVLSAVMAFVVVRCLRWKDRWLARSAAVAAGAAVALVPLSLIRNDLKQYTGDAFFVLVVLCAASAADRSSDIRAVWTLGVVALISLPFSSTTLFVSVAAFAGLLAAQLLDGRRRQALTTLAVGAVTGILMALYFVVVVLPRENAHLRNYWRDFYLTGSPWYVLRVTWIRVSHLDRELAMPRLLFVGLMVAGIVVLARMGERALAVAAPTLWLEMLLLGRARRYPFLDLRTSHFLLVPSVVITVIGAFGALHVIGRRSVGVAAAGGLALVGIFLAGSIPHIHELNIAPKGPRSQTEYLAKQRRPSDVILVNHTASSGFSYYWPHGRIRFFEANLTKGFRTEAEGVGGATRRAAPKKTS